ncbi:hypothetical protein DOTSEDRAFT_75226 [Dothistroma septosporum NZE10]|uniref:Uncharacterized protein n=1 Tax=Dothistroma septosporum (strain NZE10 / CBS 128990) TaxID=675120 RepID=M2WKI2_DOTSN|nr:hypothetical protein DOTSEDRAFT_75226 [Dothistroma septosporum NZE10]
MCSSFSFNIRPTEHRAPPAVADQVPLATPPAIPHQHHARAPAHPRHITPPAKGVASTMKAIRPNTDQEAEFQIYINNEPCKEYALPSSANTAPSNIAQCFIAVEPGDQLSIKGTFTGTVWSGTFDLVADGSFLHESRVEGKPGVEAKFMKSRKVAFEKVLNCPYPPEWTSVYPPIAMYEGTLHAKKLGDKFVAKYLDWETPVPGSDQPGIGCLSLIVSISEDSISKYHKPNRWIDLDGQSDDREIIGGWRREPVQAERELRIARPQGVIDSGITPDHQLYFQENPEDSGAGQKRSSKHRKHWQDTRPGLKAWCRFCFHYRAKSTLDEAGCVLRTEEAQHLEPATDFKKGTDSKARKNAREEEEADMSPPAKKHLGGRLEIPKSKGRLGGTFHLDGKSPSLSPGADDIGWSKNRSNTEFLRALADFEAEYDEAEGEEEGVKRGPRRAAGNAGNINSNVDSGHEHNGHVSYQRQGGKGRANVPAAVNSSHPYDRFGQPVMHSGIDTEGFKTRYLTRNGSIALGDHKRSNDLRLSHHPRSSGQVSYKVSATISSETLPARARTNSAHDAIIEVANNTVHDRRRNNMPAYDRLPSTSGVRQFIGDQGRPVHELIRYFQDHGPYVNESKVQRQFQDIVNELAITNPKTEMVMLRQVRQVRTRRDSSRGATNAPTTTTTTTRKQVSATAEHFSPSAHHEDAQAHFTQTFSYPEHVTNDACQYQAALPAADSLSTQQPPTVQKPASDTAPATSDRSRKRSVSEMTGHIEIPTSNPSKKHTSASDDDLEQARQRLEATKQRLENERREIAVKKAQKETETQQRKLAFEAEMARRAENKRIKDEKKRQKEEEKARKAEEKRLQEEERAAEDTRIREEQQEHAKQRELDAIQLQQEQEELLFAEEQIERERAEVEAMEEDYEIPPEIESESESEVENEDQDVFAAAQESEEELTDLTMMHQACATDGDAAEERSQRYGFRMSEVGCSLL